MNAYVAYKVSTRVCSTACVHTYILTQLFTIVTKHVVFQVLRLIRAPFLFLLSDVLAHVQE